MSTKENDLMFSVVINTTVDLAYVWGNGDSQLFVVWLFSFVSFPDWSLSLWWHCRCCIIFFDISSSAADSFSIVFALDAASCFLILAVTQLIVFL